jgi:predicted nucleotidyltransferase
MCLSAPHLTIEARRQLAGLGAAHLYRHGARRVWLFGSVALGRRQDARSDVDLAVEGLPGDLFYRMVSELDQLLGIPVDLVEVETASPRLLDVIRRHWILLPP